MTSTRPTEWHWPPETKALCEQVQYLTAQNRFMRARYDAAQTTPDFQNYWANADSYDADSANSKEVRQKLRDRSRYEAGNNGYVDGIVQTCATDLVGVGPALRMQTNSRGFNQMVERAFWDWAKAVGLYRKLWCMAHAKTVDGEAFGVMRRNPRVANAVKVDLVLYEAEQCQTPYLSFNEPGRIDGIRFDEFGNVHTYEFLHEHPGAANRLGITLDTELIDAQFVLHWFKARRPGQHRGIPELASTLNVGAGARRWREATIAAAETVADFTLFLKTQQAPEAVPQSMPFEQLDIDKRLITTLPGGWDMFQPKAEQPTAQYDSFNDAQINEQARPKNMPLNKAKCNSAQYNYASGRLDHQTYYAALDVERDECNGLVLDKIFSVWFPMAVRAYGWLGGDASNLGNVMRLHVWDWPKHRVADVESEANAIQTQLQSGQTFPHLVFADRGLDFDDEIQKAAEHYGVTEDELRRRMFDVLLPPPKQVASPGSAATPTEQAARAAAMAVDRLNGKLAALNGNGVHHAN